MRRHDVRSTMMTSNRPLEEWGKLLNDVPSETAILDRFLHHSDVIQITGRSYRMGNSEKIQTVPKRQPGREPNTLRSNGTTMAKVPSISPTGTVWGANGWYCLRRQLTVDAKAAVSKNDTHYCVCTETLKFDLKLSGLTPITIWCRPLLNSIAYKFSGGIGFPSIHK